MCKGAEGGKLGGDASKRFISPEETLSCCRSRELFQCELCSSAASLYCLADNAYLCEQCDKQVHTANFLALRHIRCFLCRTCQNLTRRHLVGVSAKVILPTTVTWEDGSLAIDKRMERRCSGFKED